jgi:hypothetical protein
VDWTWLTWWRPPSLLRTVVVNLKSPDMGLHGVLWCSRGRWLVLRRVSEWKPQEGRAGSPMDGEVHVDRANVAFIQVFPDADRS